MAPFSDRIKKLLRQVLPTTRITRFDHRTLQTGLARHLDVDRVHEILISAEGGNLDELFRLYRDIIGTHSHLQGRLAERKEAVIGDVLNILPKDKKKTEDLGSAAAIMAMVDNTPSWEDACIHALDSTVYPVAVLEKVFRPSNIAGIKYELAELVPVPHDLLDFTTGRLQIKDTDEEGRPVGTFHEADPNRYIVARIHTSTLPDRWGGPLRSLVFWFLLGTMDRDWWARFLDRYGAPFLVGRYDQNDDDSRSILERAFSFATKLGGLVVSRETEVEIKEAAKSDSTEAFEKFHRICNEEISKLILGQTLSSDAKSTGMGSGVAKSQDSIRSDKRQADARRLGTILREQLFRQYMLINGIAGEVPRAQWGAVSSEETEVTGALLQALSLGGLRISDEGLEALSERLGLPIERAQPSATDPNRTIPFGVRAFAADAPETGDGSILRSAIADLARTLGRDFAPIAQLIATSNSPADAIARVQSFCAQYRPTRSAQIIEEVELSLAANGSIVQGR